MKKNVGNIDRLIRFVLGVVIVILGIVFENWWGLIGVVLIGTALFRSCLLYIPFRINTSKKSQAQGDQ